MLFWRFVMSVVLIAAAVGAFAIDHRFGDAAPVFFLVTVTIALRSTWELFDMLRTRSFEPHLGICATLCFITVSVNWLPRIIPDELQPKGDVNPILVAYALAVLVLFVNRAARYLSPGKAMETLGAELIILSYVGVLISFTAQLRWVATSQLSFLPLGSLIVVTKAGDVFAYTFGRLFGRSKMAPALSPGKTWAGAIGALVGAAIGAWIWFQFATPWFSDQHTAGPVWSLALYGVVIGVMGLMGDLCESLIKRDVGRKDSATLFPGFGGLLDVIDSVIFAGPVAYLMWVFLPLTVRVPL
jgi:phosphatidate cytidylyltransferase